MQLPAVSESARKWVRYSIVSRIYFLNYFRGLEIQKQRQKNALKKQTNTNGSNKVVKHLEQDERQYENQNRARYVSLHLVETRVRFVQWKLSAYNFLIGLRSFGSYT